MFIVTESWLQTTDTKVRGDLKPLGYDLKDEPRGEWQGGGNAIIHKLGVSVTKKPRIQAKSFEHLETMISTGNKSVRILIIYRPESIEKVSVSLFYEEFSVLVERILVVSEDLLMRRF